MAELPPRVLPTDWLFQRIVAEYVRYHNAAHAPTKESASGPRCRPTAPSRARSLRCQSSEAVIMTTDESRTRT
jgi:hypothetical protein